jgi:uncharacterized peroxidase-related enzyme
MPRIAPRPSTELTEFEDMFRDLEEFFGFLPNDYLTMGYRPKLVKAIADLTASLVFDEGETDLELRLLVPYVASRAANCAYCVAHSAALIERSGLSMEKVRLVSQFETNPIFSEAERAALRVATRANMQPNAVRDEDFEELRKHFSDQAIVEIVGLIAMMAFYNRWNDTMATTLERGPQQVAATHLSGDGWSIGRHAEAAG